MVDVRKRREAGDIITDWLGQLLVIMAVLGLLGHELVTIAVTSVNLQDDAGEVARAGRAAYGDGGGLGAATAAARVAADTRGVDLVSFERDGDGLTAIVTRQAPTILVHRAGPLAELAQRTARGEARTTP